MHSQELSAMVFFYITNLHDICCTSPASLILFLRIINPCEWKPVDCHSIKDNMELSVFKYFSLTAGHLSEVKSANNLGALLFCARKGYLFSQVYLLYLEEGCSRLL